MNVIRAITTYAGKPVVGGTRRPQDSGLRHHRQPALHHRSAWMRCAALLLRMDHQVVDRIAYKVLRRIFAVRRRAFCPATSIKNRIYNFTTFFLVNSLLCFYYAALSPQSDGAQVEVGISGSTECHLSKDATLKGKRPQSMYKLAFAAIASAIAVPMCSMLTPAEAATRVTVSPVYVPAVYCSYKSKDWVQKGIVSCPEPFAPIGDLGAKWKTSSGALLCWSTNGFGGREYVGWWSPCKK